MKLVLTRRLPKLLRSLLVLVAHLAPAAYLPHSLHCSRPEPAIAAPAVPSLREGLHTNNALMPLQIMESSTVPNSARFD